LLIFSGNVCFRSKRTFSCSLYKQSLYFRKRPKHDVQDFSLDGRNVLKAVVPERNFGDSRPKCDIYWQLARSCLHLNAEVRFGLLQSFEPNARMARNSRIGHSHIASYLRCCPYTGNKQIHQKIIASYHLRPLGSFCRVA
jgi:hypothetical protein